MVAVHEKIFSYITFKYMFQCCRRFQAMYTFNIMKMLGSERTYLVKSFKEQKFIEQRFIFFLIYGLQQI